MIEEALRGEWELTTVEMVKRDGEWFAHFVLKKTVTVHDEPETIIAIDIGEHNLACCSRYLKEQPEAYERSLLERLGNQKNQRIIRTHQEKARRKEAP